MTPKYWLNTKMDSKFVIYAKNVIYDSGIIYEIWSNERKPDFWPIFSHAQSALGQSESTLGTQNRLQNHV